MAAQAGKDIVIYALMANGNYVAVAGLRTKTVDFGIQTIDVTNSDSAGLARELLQGGGVKQMNFKGQGVFQDDAAFNAVFQAFLAGTIKTYRVVIPAMGQFDGNYQVSDCNMAGNYNGEVTYDVSFASSGLITFTQA